MITDIRNKLENMKKWTTEELSQDRQDMYSMLSEIIEFIDQGGAEQIPRANAGLASGEDGGKGGPKIIGVDEIAEIIEEFTIATDEWGGSKLAEWRYGVNVCVGGIDEAAEEIHNKLVGE